MSRRISAAAAAKTAVVLGAGILSGVSAADAATPPVTNATATYTVSTASPAYTAATAATPATPAAPAEPRQCEPSPPVRQILERASLLFETGSSNAEIKHGRLAILQADLAAHPHDFFLLNELPDDEQPAQIRQARAKESRDKYPDQPVYELFYAEALAGTNTPEAIRMLEALQAAHPEMARARLALVGITQVGKFKDKARNQRELATFLELCPAPFDAARNGGALELIASEATAEQVARTAAALRKRLSQESDPLLHEVWEALWKLEFRSRPLPEHAAVRRQIAADLARFESAPQRHELAWMIFLRRGYSSAGDLAAAARLDDEIVRDYPTSHTTKRLLQERWTKENPSLPGAGKAPAEAHQRASLAAAEQWRERWPDDAYIAFLKLKALAALADTPVEQLLRAEDEWLAAYHKSPDFYSVPPPEFHVAEALINRKAGLERVPELVAAGERSFADYEAWELNDDRINDEQKAETRETITDVKLEGARLLLDLHAATQQAAKAPALQALDSKLAGLEPTQASSRSSLLALRARAAELENRKLDALLLYRAALAARGPAPPSPRDKDRAADNLERLWKELGGTPAGHALLLDRLPAAEVADSRWERPKHPLPAFVLGDLSGKTWKLADLGGKAVLINVWATWCGPCRMEHPQFQQLYDKLKGRPDVVVLSFNVDDDLGKIEPYMKANKYTFPAIPARDVVDAVVPSLAIPRNWFVDPRGKLEWEQLGFDPDPAANWQQTVLAKLEEVLKPP
jgi:thiol-disulfide isomerase/thioredoxin